MTSTLRHPRALLAAVTLASLLVAGACSSSNEPSPTTSSTATPATGAAGQGAPAGTATPGTERAGTSTTTGGETGPTDSQVGAPTTAPSGPSSTSLTGGPTSSVVVAPQNQAFCDRVAEASRDFQGMDTQNDPTALTKLKTTFGELVDLAPADIKDDVVAFNSAIQSASSFDDLAKLESQQLTDASDRLSAWTEANCGA